MQHFQVFGIGIVFGEGEIELGIHRDDFGADAPQRFRRKRARRAVAAGRDHLDGARQFVALGDGLQIGLAHVGHGDIAAAGAFLAQSFQHDLLDRIDFVRPEGQRPLRAHLHAGPAIFIVAGGHHRNGGAVQRKLREIGNRRQGEADVMDFAAGAHQADRQRLLDGERIGPVIVARNHLGLDADLMEIGSQSQAQRLYAQKIDFLAEQPARVIFAKAVGGHQRQILVIGGVGLEVRAGLDHQNSVNGCGLGFSRTAPPPQPGSCGPRLPSRRSKRGFAMSNVS